MYIENDLKEKLAKRKITVGSWLQISHPITTEIMAQAGFEWLVVDLEHSVIELSEMQVLFQVMQAYNVIALARLSSNDVVQTKRVMDAGAAGIIVPNVNSARDAQQAVQNTKYPPLGKRGVGLARAQGYGLEFERYKKWVNKNSIVVVQIEHIEAVNNLEKILAVKGVDASIIGPYDLSASMGYPGKFDKKEVKETIKRYIKICKRLNKSAGFHVIASDFEEVKKKAKQGFNFLAFNSDVLFLAHKCQMEMSKIKRNLL